MNALNLFLGPRSKKSSKTRANKRRDRTFRFELLEPRQLLSCGGTPVDGDTLDPLSIHKYENVLPQGYRTSLGKLGSAGWYICG
jgi:hypothetical protein